MGKTRTIYAAIATRERKRKLVTVAILLWFSSMKNGNKKASMLSLRFQGT